MACSNIELNNKESNTESFSHPFLKSISSTYFAILQLLENNLAGVNGESEDVYNKLELS